MPFPPASEHVHLLQKRFRSSVLGSDQAATVEISSFCDALRTFPARVAPHAFQSAAGHTPAQAPRAVESATSPFPAPVVAHRQPPSAPGDLVGAPSCAPTAAAAQSSGQRFHQLSKLMAWKQQGLLSEDEFVKLKRELCS